MIKGDREEFPLEGSGSLSSFVMKKTDMPHFSWIMLESEIRHVLISRPIYLDRSNWKAIITRTAPRTYRLDIVAISLLYRDREKVELSYEIKTRVWDVMPYLGPSAEKIDSIVNLITKQELK
ncbi:hypothetical protein [Burkholderia phage FLC9]|nr:hypothetical protein [Burkholderia phage FLC9]